ncbi:plasmid mobilization protein [Petrimonas sp.]|uniref:plasmid mobilization protein n=1 Tax=Petrimonas sp. TaxID=2023866 RepID=UPI003F518090
MTSKIPGKKGGRPAKSLAEKRKYRLSLKLNTKEYFQLKSKSKTAGKNRCDFLREFILTGEVKQRFTPEQNDTLRKICGMANNLNQVAKKAHEQGVWYIERTVEEQTAKLDELLKRIKL